MGIVILGPEFLQQRWPQQELNDLANREANGNKLIMPIRHKVSFRDVFDYSPVLSDAVAISTGQASGVRRVMNYRHGEVATRPVVRFDEFERTWDSERVFLRE
jgi:hypothetical protein